MEPAKFSVSRNASEYANARALNEALTGSGYFSNQYKDHREWHILGAAHSAHTRVQRPFPTYAIKRQSPDFELFNTPSHAAYPLEVTMVIPPDYKLHRHHKEWEAAGGMPQDHPYPAYRDHWDWLRARIGEKRQEPYAKGCALLVYFDVSLHDTVEQNPSDFASAIAGEWHRHPQGDFGLSTIRASGIRTVIVMSADMRALVEIYPRLDVVAI